MNPENRKIENIIAQEPKLIKRKTFNFISIPLRIEEEEGAMKKISLLLKDQKFRIFRSDYTGDKTYSIGITLEGKLLDFMKNLEKHIRKLAVEKQLDARKLSPRSANYGELDFNLLKPHLKTKTWSLYGKLYLTEGKINSPFFQLVEKDGRVVKKKINLHDLLGAPLKGSIVIDINQIFCGAVKSITCVVKETLIKKEHRIPSVFDEFEDESDAED